MDSRYDHTKEQKLYNLWEQSGSFNPDNLASRTKQQFSIIMPPPNANDPLHIGHAMFIAIEDVMTRFHRMWGDKTLWLPGTDHAGIETQFVYEKKLAKEGKSRFNFDRETLFSDIWQYVQENSNTAIDQTKKLGASADWSRFKFTLDEDVREFVLNTFKNLHKDGMIYRDLQLVNYCTKCGTSFSELEINHQDSSAPLYYVKYKFVDEPDKFVSVATVRPEPIFADTHLAVHPNDPSKQDLVGKKVLNPLTGAEMEIIADEMVDPEFGTGVVKLTPAHDHNDFAVAKRLNLPMNQAINTRGKITENGGKYAGLSVVEARKQVVADLQAAGLIEKIDEKYQNRVATCYRCGRAIEPLPLPQFFIKVRDEKNNLVKAALESLDSGETKILGAGYDKILRHWLNNLRDWNISRQIVWGISMPVWYEYRGNEDKITISFVDSSSNYQTGLLSELLQNHSIDEVVAGLQQLVADPAVPYSVSVKNPGDNSTHLPETDTLDTWFSSSQWPVVTLKTNQPGDFDTFYPTSIMETAYDILPFWVMRMMLMGIYLTGKSPFSTVYLHGLIRDQKGQKMSKSKGNVVNPLEVVEKYGADALRMALVIRSSPGLDKSVSDNDFKAMRNFANKIWNASRFVLIGRENNPGTQSHSLDKETRERMDKLIAEVTDNLHKNQLGIAADRIYDEFWHWYCDDRIEISKSGKISDDMMFEVLLDFLKLIHPFMPFVTEKIWQELVSQNLIDEPMLITAGWPQPNN